MMRATMPAAPASSARAAAGRMAWRLRALQSGLLLACGVLAAAPANAQAPARGCLQVPFAQQVDLDTLDALLRAAPSEMLARIAALDIDVLRVPSVRPGRPANPLLAALPEAGDGLLRQAEFHDSYEGRSLPAGAACCGRPRATVLIRDTAPTYTLLHEVLHLLIVPTDGITLRADLETRFALALHRLNVYQRRVYDDPARLLEPLWRRDIAQALRDVTALLFDRLRIGQSQEAIVEKLLAGCIDERSPYFDDARRAEGRRYGAAMVDNAVDVFNALHAALAFCADAVRHLREDVVAGRLDEAAGAAQGVVALLVGASSEGRRGGEECRSRGATYPQKSFYGG